MVLRPALRDLQRAESVAQCHAAFQAPALFQTEEQRAAEGVAAARGVDHLSGLHTWHARALALHPQIAPFGGQRHDDALQVGLRQRLQRLACALAQHAPFVVVDGDPGGQPDEFLELGPVELRQLLARVEDEGDAGLVHLARAVLHRFAAVGRNDPDGQVLTRGRCDQVRVAHGAGVEGRDLVVVAVGDDDRLCGVQVLVKAHVLGVQAQ